MNQFFFGDNDEYIQVAYAPSGRAACKTCKSKIEKQAIRISYIIPIGGHYSSTNWYHLTCFELKPKFIDIDPEQQICSLEQLDRNQNDKEIVLDYINQEKKRLKKEVKQSKKASVPKKKQSVKEKEKPSTKKSKAKSTEKASEKYDSEDETRNYDSDDDYASSKKDKKKKKKKQSKKQPQKPATPAYTPQQQILFDELVYKYNGYTTDTLKLLLSKNNQTKTGNKPQLVEKCADGKILGQIPHCPHCGGGWPKFNRETGLYKCSGYMDDDHFRNCHKTFTMEEIQREPWID